MFLRKVGAVPSPPQPLSGPGTAARSPLLPVLVCRSWGSDTPESQRLSSLYWSGSLPEPSGALPVLVGILRSWPGAGPGRVANPVSPGRSPARQDATAHGRLGHHSVRRSLSLPIHGLLSLCLQGSAQAPPPPGGPGPSPPHSLPCECPEGRGVAASGSSDHGTCREALPHALEGPAGGSRALGSTPPP